DVDVAVAMEIRLDAKLLRARARVTQRRLRRLFHYIAERSGELNPSVSLYDADFDLQHFAADLRVRQSGRDADFVLERCVVGIERRIPEQLLEVRNFYDAMFYRRIWRVDGNRLFRALASHLPRDARDSALELAHSR